MAKAFGDLSRNQPRISRKTPVGRQIAENAESDSRIEFMLEKATNDGVVCVIEERLDLKIKKIGKDRIRLEPVPTHITNEYDFNRNSNRITMKVYSITSGDTTHTVTPVETPEEMAVSERTETQDPPDPDYSDPPTEELSRTITADVIESLGYDVETSVTRETVGGDTLAADVWAESPRANFSIYASCENWDSQVDRATVREEADRVRSLKSLPQLRVLVVGDATDDARESIETTGFLPVILGEQADTESANDLYRDIHSQLDETLLAIAPPSVGTLADHADELSRDLAELSEKFRQVGN